MDSENSRIPEEFTNNNEVKEKEPKLHFDFFFGPHYNAQDIEDMKPQFEQADIFVKEHVTWSKEELDFYNNISEGNQSLEEAMEQARELFNIGSSSIPEYLEALIKLLHGSKKLIYIADIPEGHEAVKTLSSAKKSFKQYAQSNVFEEKVDRLKEYIDKFAEYEKQREGYMKTQLMEDLPNVVKDHPELSSKDDLNVLIQVGVSHTRMYKDLEEDGISVSRQFSEDNLSWDYFDEAWRRKMFDKEVPDELAAHVILQFQFLKHFGRDLDNLTTDTFKQYGIIREKLSEFSIEEIKEIMEAVQSGSDFKELFKQKLTDKGITFEF